MFRAAWEERVTIIKPRGDKGGHEVGLFFGGVVFFGRCFLLLLLLFFRVYWKKTPNCANTFRIGRTADVLYVQFCAHVISDVKTKISGRRRKRYFTATDRDGSRFADWKGLRRWAQEEGLCLIIVKFKFVFQHPGLDVWQTGFQRRYCRLNVRWRDRDLELSIFRERLRLNRVTLNQVRKRFCVEEEENWAQHKTLWHTIGKAWDLWDVVIDDDWLCSICQIRRKTRRVQYRRCHACVGVC